MSKKVFDQNYKRKIVKMLIEQNKTVAQVSRETGININTLYSWRKKFEIEFIHGALPHMTEQQRLRFFKKRIRILEKENKILKEKRIYLPSE